MADEGVPLYMTFDDPREQYDDLLVTEHRQELQPEEFEEAVESEAVRIGYVVLGFVFDDSNRVLLINQQGMDGWAEPGGEPQPGESLAEAVTREVREETGVESTPVRPHMVDELTLDNEQTDESVGWTTVFFEAEAVTTEFDGSLGLEDEAIDGAGWFESLPENVFAPEVTEQAYLRCRQRRDLC